MTSSDEATSLAVTGSTGALGGRVGHRLADRRHRPAADPPPACEGAELAVASSYGDEVEMRAALEGMESPKGVIRGPAGEGIWLRSPATTSPTSPPRSSPSAASTTARPTS